MTLDLFPSSGATFSHDRKYRYRLWREWGDPANRCVWVMCNPSVASEAFEDSDPTVGKCMGFAKRWGYSAIDVVNLFAWVSTDVRGLLVAADPVGPKNDDAIVAAVTTAKRVVLAWGTHKPVSALLKARSASVHALLAEHCRAMAVVTFTLGRNMDLTPRHPLMLAYNTPVEVP
jgi:hypothetical protein